MNRYFFLLIINLFLSALRLDAQNLKLDKTEHDFGEIVAGNERVADFTIINPGSSAVYLLKADAEEDCIVRFSEKVIAPQQQAVIRIKYNPEKKGKFQRKIAVYSGDAPEPFFLSIKGNVKELEDNPLTQCPNFDTPLKDKQPTQSFTVQVIDAATKKPIQKAKVHVQSKEGFHKSVFTAADGKNTSTIPVGLYNVQAEAENYTANSTNIYIGRGYSFIVVALDRNKTVEEEKPLIAVKEVTKEEENKEEENVVAEKTAESESVITDLPGELPRSAFSPNNIVFLIDVSSSMDRADKLPLLKVSMKKLLYTLRDVDRVSIVTYASGTKILLPSTAANNKEAIAAQIDALTPGGSTQGGKGIREAYRVAEENFIKTGNNQIILATDGDFNLDQNDVALFKFIEEKSKTGIGLSVAGFGKKEKALQKMDKIAKTGNGSYIQINNSGQAENAFVEEIKNRSKK